VKFTEFPMANFAIECVRALQVLENKAYARWGETRWFGTGLAPMSAAD
jgi:hypothetical protein